MTDQPRKPAGSAGGTGGEFDYKPGGNASDLPDIFNPTPPKDSLEAMSVEQEHVLETIRATHTLPDGITLRRRVTYIQQALAVMPDTQTTFSWVDAKGRRHYTPEREQAHQQIVDDMLADAQQRNVGRHGWALMTGGLAGSGKSSTLASDDFRHSFKAMSNNEWLTLNNDDIKEEMAKRGMIPPVRGLTPMEACPLVHEEASDVLALLRERALEQHMDVILDGTMNNQRSTRAKIRQLHEAGYRVQGMFVDIDLDQSKTRAQLRYQRGLLAHANDIGGRVVPSEIIERQRSDDPRFRSRNARVFSELGRDGVFDGSPIVYDNNGSGPRRASFEDFVEGRHVTGE